MDPSQVVAASVSSPWFVAREGRGKARGASCALMQRRRATTHTTELLRRLPIFAQCTRDELVQLLPHTDVITVPVGTTFGGHGSAVREFLGIVDGHVDGRDRTSNAFVLGPGDHIGADELLADEDHCATYTATTPVTIVAMFGPTFRGLTARMPAVAERARRPRCR